MITGHSENLPKNRFGELDELEQREHLDNSGGKSLQEGSNFPISAFPYDAKFAYPFAFPYMNTGFSPATVPVWWSSDEYGDDKSKTS